MKSLESRHAPTAAQIVLASAYLSMPVAEMIDKAIKGGEASSMISAGMLDKMKKMSKDLHERLYTDELASAEKSVESLKKQYEQAKAYLQKLKTSIVGHGCLSP